MGDFFKKIVLVLLLFISCGKDQSQSSKVKTVKEIKKYELPETAFLIKHPKGSYWYNVEEVNSHKNKAKLSIYRSDSQKLIVKADFFIVCVFDDKRDAVFIENLKNQIDYFDGRNIQFKNSRTYLKQIVR